MAHPPHPLSNVGFAKQYFDTLSADDITRRYYAGQKYQPSFTNKLKMLFFTESILCQLTRFYPYQPSIQSTSKAYKQRKQSSQLFALLFTAASITTIFQLAKRNCIAPVFNKFGGFSRSHRLFKQYVLFGLIPYAYATYSTNSLFSNQVERLWSIHANRFNNKILTDPEDSQYPVDQLPVSQVHSWRPLWIHKYDLKKKWQNEVNVFAAPDYQEIEQWQKVPIAEQESEGGEDEEGDEQQ